MTQHYRRGAVHKFGGTSVINAKQDKAIISGAVNTFRTIRNYTDEGYMVIVLSGIGKTDSTQEGRKATDHAYDIVKGIHPDCAWRNIKGLYQRNIAEHGLDTKLLEPSFRDIEKILASGNIDKVAEARIVGFPERAKVRLAYEVAKVMYKDTQFAIIDGRTGMVGQANGNYRDVPIDHSASLDAIAELARDKDLKGKVIFVPGFVGTRAKITGRAVTLERGSSDATATYWGSALDLDEVVIFSDQSGILPIDPRIVPDVKPLEQLTYRETAVFAGLGASIIQDVAIRPAEERRIPVVVRHSSGNNGVGTSIGVCPPSLDHFGVKAIAADTGYYLITVQNVRMNETGIAQHIQGMFAQSGFNIAYHQDGDDCLVFGVKDDGDLNQLLGNLGKNHQVSLDTPMTRLALVGEGINAYRHLNPHQSARDLFTDVLAENDIPDLAYSRVDGAISLSTFIPERYTELALQKLARSLKFK